MPPERFRGSEIQEAAAGRRRRLAAERGRKKGLTIKKVSPTESPPPEARFLKWGCSKQGCRWTAPSRLSSSTAASKYSHRHLFTEGHHLVRVYRMR